MKFLVYVTWRNGSSSDVIVAGNEDDAVLQMRRIHPGATTIKATLVSK